jgi:hypothetical protein
VQDEQRRQPPVDGRHAGGGAKENDLEQAALVRSDVMGLHIMTVRILV